MIANRCSLPLAGSGPTHNCFYSYLLLPNTVAAGVLSSVRVWIDVLTPKHALFFEPLYRELVRDGNDVLITTRAYREAVESLLLRRLPFRIVGEHGGASRIGKLLASARRIDRLASPIAEWKPDTSISFSSPEAARVAFGLGIPHVAANDSPHSWRVARLSIPLARYVCCPWIFPKSIWLSFGGRDDGIFTYRALDAAAWLKKFKPNPKVLRQLSVETDRPIIVLRTEESFASYLEGRASDTAPVIGPVVNQLIKLKLEAQILISTRYGLQAPTLKKKFGSKVRVIDHVVDSTSLLYYSTMFIGSGGTMTVEAALLGKPAISCFPGDKPRYIRYLEGKGLVRTVLSPKKIALLAKKTMSSERSKNAQQRRGSELLNWMEDPIRVISKIVRRSWNQTDR